MTDDTRATTLQQKIDDYAQQTAKKAADICRRHNVPKAAADAMAADAADMLNARYNGLCATTEQMRQLTDNTPQRSWDRTENAALCFIAKYYAQILQILDGTPVIGSTFLNAVVYCEVAKRQNTTTAAVIEDMGGTYTDDIEAEAQRLYYTYAVLTIAEHTNATEAELLTIEPGAPVDEARRRRVVASAIDMQQQRARIMAASAARKARKTPGEHADTWAKRTKAATPTLFDGEKTIQQYQNITFMLSGGIQTADIDEAGRSKVLRPLRQGIEEQRQAAAEVLNDTNATEARKKKASQLIATTTAVWQVLDGIQIITQTMQPDGSGDTYTRYDMTPHEFARICTGTEKPKKEQILSVLRATAWLRTQSMQVWEQTEKLVTERDESGAIIRDEYGKAQKKRIRRDICTDFQPIVVEFRSEYQNEVLIEDATRIRLHIHDIIKEGRSAQYYIDNGGHGKERLTIVKPQTHVLQLSQIYDFASDEEKAFRNVIVSKSNQAEDKLLAAVFDYDARRQQYQKSADEAQRMADVLNGSATATDEEKQAAKEAANTATEKAKYYITNHMGDDVQRLKGMFNKAKENGLILWYSRDEAAKVRGSKKYGSGWVWKWQRPTAEDIKKSRSARRRNK